MIAREKATAIRELADANGYIEPRDVVAAARDPEHPLHEEFEWNQQLAAEANWLDTARRLIRLVKVEFTFEERVISSVAYVVDPDRPPKSRRYIDLTIAAQQQQVAQAVLLAEMGRITAAIRRARQVAARLGLADQLEALLENVSEIVEAAEIPRPAKTRGGAKKRAAKTAARKRTPAREQARA